MGQNCVTSFMDNPHVIHELERLSSAWRLDNYVRHDVQQADIAALMTSLLGLNFPANSVGVVPVEMLSTSWEYKTECLLANLLAIHAQYQVIIQLDLDINDYMLLSGEKRRFSRRRACVSESTRSCSLQEDSNWYSAELSLTSHQVQFHIKLNIITCTFHYLSSFVNSMFSLFCR
jgi:hypothetical protein